MSGHSKWATTKHKKAAIDAKRGKLFAKLIKNIEIAARLGGGDPDGNPSLYDAIYKAKKASMPADNIARAVKRGAGAEDGAANYEDIVYEGYAPAGVGLIIECLTDNRNRAAAEVRSTLTKGNGSLATSGSVSFNFERKGQIVVPSEGVDFDKLFETAAEAGAEDVTDDGEVFTGSFPGFQTQVSFDPANPAAGKLDVTIPLVGAKSGNTDRDSTLQGADFFNVAQFAQARYTANGFRALGNNQFAADGTLELRGVSKPVTLTFTWAAGAQPVLTGKATVKRLDFGVGGGDWADTKTIPNETAISTIVKLNAK